MSPTSMNLGIVCPCFVAPSALTCSLIVMFFIAGEAAVRGVAPTAARVADLVIGVPVPILRVVDQWTGDPGHRCAVQGRVAVRQRGETPLSDATRLHHVTASPQHDVDRKCATDLTIV